MPPRLTPANSMRTLGCLLLLAVLAIPAGAQRAGINNAKEAWIKARKGSDQEQVEALNALSSVGSVEALKFLLGELRKDLAARNSESPKDDLLSSRVRTHLHYALCQFKSPLHIAVFLDAAKGPKGAQEHEIALEQLDILCVLAALRDEQADKYLKSAIAGKNPYLKSSALEAARKARRVEFIDSALAVIGEHSRDWLRDYRMVVLSALDYLRDRVTQKDTGNIIKLIEALIALDQWAVGARMEFPDRIEYAISRTLYALTNESWSIHNAAAWRWWIAQVQGGAAVRPAAPDGDPRVRAFEAEVVGKRIVFLIDMSISMKDPLPKGLKEIIKSNLCWDCIRSKLDLAREELAASIERLAPRADTKFAIVVYSTQATHFTSGWVEANPQNCAKWSTEARKIGIQALTNAHAALFAGLRISDKGTRASDPVIDRDCLSTGADCFIVLSDGYSTWSDDSTEQDVPDPRGGTGKIGNGKLIKAPDILIDFTRVNLFRRVLVHTIGIGTHDKELLKGLALSSGGQYIDWAGK